MNVLFLSLLDFADIDESNIYTDLLREFKKHGHNLYIVSPVERRKGQKTTQITSDGVRILKPKILNVQKTNIIEKGMSTILLENQILNAIKKYFTEVSFDLVLYSTPPITFEKIIFLLYHVITRLGKEGISMEQDRVRIVDVADALGLSTATVSKVIFRTWLDSPKNFLTFFQFWVLLFL